MRCPNCSFENPSDARFCENCGQPLERVCPNCGTRNSPTARFCKKCGFALAETPAPAAPARLSALLQAAPDSLQRRMRAAGTQVEGERKAVTILFADIVGSTALAEKMDPEEWREIVSGVLFRVSEAIYRYEGTIAQLLGDGVLAFFGAPLAHEDDPMRAIRAGLDLQSALAEYRLSLAAHGHTQNVHVRVGVNTGLVVVGNVGSDLHMEYLAIGETVNLAARLQSAAQPDSVLISSKTFHLVEPFFDFRDLGAIQVKGESNPVQVYEVMGERKGALPLRGIAGLSSPMVGRDRELSTLMQAVKDVRSGRGSVVSIIGEAGVGKSRLVAEWRRAALAETGEPRVRWVEGRCLSYGASIPFHLSASVLRGLLGVGPDAAESETHAALRATTEELFGLAMIEVYPYLGLLLGLQLEPDIAERVKGLEGPVLQGRYVDAFKRLLQAMAGKGPIVLVCEDIHWADQASVALSLQLLALSAETPLVTAFITRPEKDSAGWKLVDQAKDTAGVGVVQLYLSPLKAADSLQLVTNLLGLHSLQDKLQQLILTKAEGNPFFVEEVIRMLIDHHGLVQRDSHWAVTGEVTGIAIPDTLLGVLQARIDRLPEEVKRTLQVASVIGRSFELDLLADVLGVQPAALKSQLDVLLSSGLVREVLDDASRYVLRHALVQDAAYASLLKQDRKKLHLSVAHSIEKLNPDRLDELAPVLLRHYQEAGEDKETLDYATRAGLRATRLYAYAEARGYFATALGALARLPDTEENRRQKVDLVTNQVKVSFASDAPEKNLERVNAIEPLAQELPGPDGKPGSDVARLAAIHFWQGRMYYQLNKAKEAVGYYVKVLEVGPQLQDRDLLAIPASMMGRAALTQGQFGKAAELLRQAAEPLEKAGNLQEWASTIGYLGEALAFMGHYAEALEQGKRCRAIADQTKNATSIALSRIFIAQSYFQGGELEAALAENRAALDVVEKSGDRVIGYIALGVTMWAETRLGHDDEAKQALARWEELTTSLGGRLIVADWFAAAKAEIFLNAGEIQEALTLAQEAAAFAKSANGLLGEGVAHRIWAQALAQVEPDRAAEAGEHFAESVRLLESGQALLEAARTEAAWGEFCHTQRDEIAACEHLQKAAAQFETSGLTAELERTRGRLQAIQNPAHAVGDS